MTEQEKATNKPVRGQAVKRGRSRRRFDSKEPADEFQQRLVDLARVTRVMAGGKRMKFRACMVVGDGKGRVGAAVAKGSDVSDAITKAVKKAKKHLITVPIIDGTLPHRVDMKFRAARLLIKPAKKGNGVKAGGVVRIILELAGVEDAIGKILGSNNKVNNTIATLQALNSFKVSAKPLTKVKIKKDQGSEQPTTTNPDELAKE